MSKQDKTRAELNATLATILNPFFDGWVLMLALGGIGHKNGWPQLYLSYWTCLLIVVVSVCLIPQNYNVSRYLGKLIEKI